MAETKLEIDELRQHMAQADARLVALLNERARAARRIGELRRDQPAVLPLSDRSALEHLVSGSSGDLPADALRRVLGTVFAECLAIELPVKVVFVGEDGGPAQAAARGRFGAVPGMTSAETAAEAFDTVSRRRAEFAVVPLETSVEGPVQATLTALLTSDLRIAQVVEIALDLVIANRSGNRADVEHLHATPNDFARCRRVVDELFPRASRVDARSPMAACNLAREDGASAAIALESITADAGLALVRRGAVDSAVERMRLAIVGTRPSGRTGKEVSSFVFTVHEEPGALLGVLNVFAERGIPLTKIHSQPAKTDAWAYVFFGEAVGHFTDRPLVMAFEEVKRVTRTFKLLGSYPAPAP